MRNELPRQMPDTVRLNDGVGRTPPSVGDGVTTDVDPDLVANSTRLVRNIRGEVIFDPRARK